MSEFQAWCERVELTEEGQFRLSNIWHDCCSPQACLNPSDVQELFSLIESAWDSTIDPVSSWLIAKDIMNAKVEFLKFKGVSVKPLSALCATAMPYELFETIFVDRPVGKSVGAVAPKHKLRQESLQRAIDGSAARAKKYPRRFAWVTDASALENGCKLNGGASKPDMLAKSMTSLLGLIHVTGTLDLIELEIPSAALTLWRPTFLDGWKGDVYRSKVGIQHWGMTIALTSILKGNKAGDGMPEAVHGPVMVQSSFKARHVGRVTIDPVVLEYDSLLSAAPEPWKPGYAKALDEWWRPL